jgi:hypothetical protein
MSARLFTPALPELILPGDPPPVVPADRLALEHGAHDALTRLSSGYTVKEVASLAAAWWDGVGRKQMHAQFRDPDHAFDSGITRGLTWTELDERERRSVTMKYHRHHILEIEA